MTPLQLCFQNRRVQAGRHTGRLTAGSAGGALYAAALKLEAAAVSASVGSAEDWGTVLLVGLLANGVPYGYAVGMVVETALVYARRRRSRG